MARTPRAEAPSVPITVRFSPAERDRITEALRVNRQNMTEFVRDALMNAAEDCLERPFVIQNSVRH